MAPKSVQLNLFGKKVPDFVEPTLPDSPQPKVATAKRGAKRRAGEQENAEPKRRRKVEVVDKSPIEQDAGSLNAALLRACPEPA